MFTLSRWTLSKIQCQRIRDNTEAWAVKLSEMWACGFGWNVDHRAEQMCWSSSEEGVGAAGHHGPGRTGRLPPHSGQQGRAVHMRVRKGTGAPGAGRQSNCWPRFTSFQPKITQMSWESRWKLPALGFHVSARLTPKSSLWPTNL